MPADWRTAVRFAEPVDPSAGAHATEAADAAVPEPPLAAVGPAPPRQLDVEVTGALEGMLLLRDQILHGMDERDAGLVVALLDGATVTDAASQVGISQQAASRRLRSNGGYALVRSWDLLDGGSG